MKTFNTSGRCVPERHYMVNIEDKLKKMKQLVDAESYFVINRARQYGKTTTLGMLAEYLKEEYAVISMDFQMMSEVKFQSEQTFSGAFAACFLDITENRRFPVPGLQPSALEQLRAHAKDSGFGLMELFADLSKVCETSEKRVVLMIDEVDSASNNQVFLDFLGQLRAYYLAREWRPTFSSVILAGVYDIKNLKLKLRPEAEHKYNSPWNIAEPFDVDMSFSADAIAGMLREYEEEHHTGMDVAAAAQSIYAYTSGYPFLVSLVCKTIDTKLCDADGRSCAKSWSVGGVAEAVKLILKTNRIPLFDSMVKQLDIYPELRGMIEDMLYQGKQIPFSPDVEAVSVGVMFGFLKEKENMVVVANRIFEMRLLNLFIAEEASKSETYRAGLRDKNQFVSDGRLNMELVLRKFTEHYTEIYAENDEAFVESQGRKLFLLYLKPIINGTGNYYVEAETRDLKRTDVIVDYRGEQFVIELKIYHGEAYREKGEKQLADYLDHYRLKKGYMLTFNFNKKKTAGIRTVVCGDKVITEAVV